MIIRKCDFELSLRASRRVIDSALFIPEYSRIYDSVYEGVSPVENICISRGFEDVV